MLRSPLWTKHAANFSVQTSLFYRFKTSVLVLHWCCGVDSATQCEIQVARIRSYNQHRIQFPIGMDCSNEVDLNFFSNSIKDPNYAVLVGFFTIINCVWFQWRYFTANRQSDLYRIGSNPQHILERNTSGISPTSVIPRFVWFSAKFLIIKINLLCQCFRTRSKYKWMEFSIQVNQKHKF